MTRDLAWQRVIDDAIHLCRVLAKWEAAEARKFNPNWDEQPRIPAGNADGGQWTDGGGGEPAAAAAIGAAAAVAEGSTDTARARAALQAIGRIAGQARTVASGAAAAIATPASAIAAGILIWQVFMFMDGPPEYHCRLGAAGMDVRLMRLQGTQPVVLRSFTAPLQPFLESWIREFDTLSYRYGKLSDTAYEEAEIENCLDLRRQIVRALADIEAGDSEAMANS